MAVLAVLGMMRLDMAVMGFVAYNNSNRLDAILLTGARCLLNQGEPPQG
jgi:hypothetical protein